MEMANILLPVLQEAVNWNLARVQFLSCFLIALLQVKTVNFVEIATAFGSKAKTESSYKRIQRFFRSFAIDFTVIAWLVVKMLPIGDSPWILTMDRTNWKLGKKNINVLILGIAYRGIAFPLIWVLLPKRGNSNTRERISLLNRFICIFSLWKIQCLTADREFLGEEWFGYLVASAIPFRIRIRENMWITNASGVATKAKNLFRHLTIGQSEILPGSRIVDGHRLFVIGLKLIDEYVIIVTNHAPQTALEDYARRWEIETLFSCLKSRGFRFEETHLTNGQRIEKLIALLAIAFCWVHLVGEWVHEQKPIKIKKHGRKACSFFHCGLVHLRKLVLNFAFYLQQFLHAVEILALALHPICNIAMPRHHVVFSD